MSRKEFLGAAGAGAAAATLGGCATGARGPAVAPAAVPQERRADVLVVGAGMGGLTAAVRAAREGADVVVLEKAAEAGGTMQHSAGAVWTYERYEDMRQDAPEADARLQRTHWETLPAVYDWFDGIGAPLGAPGAGRRRMRRIAPVAFRNFMVSDLEGRGGTILTETPMIRLLVNRRHEVIGVLAEGPDGPLRVLADAVILATGGWAGNARLMHQNITRMYGSLWQRNSGYRGREPAPLTPLLTGDGLLAATAIGAATSDGGFDSFYGHLLPARPARFGVGAQDDPLVNYSLYHGQWCPVLNVYGRRFADESRGRLGARELAGGPGEQIICQESARQPEATVAYVWDHRINQERALAEQNLGDIDKFQAFKDAGAPVARGDTLGELAVTMERWGRGFPADVVGATLREYTAACENDKAHVLDVPKVSQEHAIPLTEPPFYAVLGHPGITGPHGGLKVDSGARVLNSGGYPIKGLYAAGIDVGNIGPYVYMGFLAIGATFGYMAGANAAREPAPQGGREIGHLS